jgi:hypothetical protein
MRDSPLRIPEDTTLDCLSTPQNKPIEAHSSSSKSIEIQHSIQEFDIPTRNYKTHTVCVKRQEVPILVGSKNALISPQLPISFRKYLISIEALLQLEI